MNALTSSAKSDHWTQEYWGGGGDNLALFEHWWGSRPPRPPWKFHPGVQSLGLIRLAAILVLNAN